MFKKYLLLLIALLALGASNAKSITPSSPKSITPEVEYSCNLPAPTNFHVTEIGPTWVRLDWVMNAANVQHRVRTYKVPGNILISTITVAAGQENVFIWNLSPQDTFYSVINAICKNGEQSTYEIPTPWYTTITDELVVSGFTPIANPMDLCTIDLTVNDRCILPYTDTYTFRIKEAQGSNERQFQVAVNYNYMDGIVKMDADNSDPDAIYRIQVDGHDPDYPGSLYEIKLFGNETVIAAFRVSLDADAHFMVRRQSLNSNYVIQRITEEKHNYAPPSNHSRLRETGSDGKSIGQVAVASPNPFSEVLEVALGQNIVDNITLQLFNLSGQKVLDQQFPGGQEQYTLSTAGLSNGFYLLRIEADGEVQTLKVIKSE